MASNASYAQKLVDVTKPEESGALAIPWCRFAKTDRRTTSEKIGTGVSATAREACGPSRDRCTGSTPGTQRFLPGDEHRPKLRDLALSFGSATEAFTEA